MWFVGELVIVFFFFVVLVVRLVCLYLFIMIFIYLWERIEIFKNIFFCYSFFLVIFLVYEVGG